MQEEDEKDKRASFSPAGVFKPAVTSGGVTSDVWFLRPVTIGLALGVTVSSFGSSLFPQILR